MTAAWAKIHEGELSLVGDLTFDTIPALCHAIRVECSLFSDVKISLSKVQQCDSASLVLLLSIIEHFKKSQFSVSFTDIPKTIQTLIALYNLHSIISTSHGQ